MAFGVAIVVNEVCLCLALLRLPLGMAVTLEFLGPLALALSRAQQPRHLACALAALLGVICLCASRVSADPPAKTGDLTSCVKLAETREARQSQSI